MGPCVRLIRALGARPELNEEEKRARWLAIKNKVKTEGLGLREVKIGQSIDPDLWEIIRVGAMKNPSIDNEEMLAGIVWLTYSDGKTEEAQCVHYKRNFEIDTTILTSTKEIRSTSCRLISNPINCFNGISITTHPTGEKDLASVDVPLPPWDNPLK
jgi:hypothetical protein